MHDHWVAERTFWFSARGKSAVNDKRTSDDETRCVGYEVQDRVRNLIRSSEPTEGLAGT
jgi:hypothetical protein